MFYINITHTAIRPTERYIHNNWVNSKKTNFFKKHVLARVTHFTLVPASLIISALDAIIGLGAGMAAICTLGKHEKIFHFASSHLRSSSEIIARPYINLLQTLNPKVDLSSNISVFENPKYPIIGAGDNGFITHFISKFLENIASRCYNSENFVIRHVVSRLTYPLLAISCLVTRVVDGIIGIGVAPLSLLTGGKFESLNNLAYRALQVPGIIDDLFYCTIMCINPWAGTSKA